MRRENIAHSFISAASAVLLLILFVPVFYCTIFIGNGVNYNPEHKIEALYPNTLLLLFALLALLIFAGLFVLLEKIPTNKYTLLGTVLFTALVCCLFYFVKVEVSKCIAFYGGWDCGMVANSARWVYNGEDIGYDDYYYIFINNVPITWLLYALYGISSSLPNYAYNPEFIWIQFQCLMFALALFFSVMTVLMICKKIAPTLLSLLAGVILLGLCPWQIIPYTDASTIAIPAMVIFLYALFRHVRSKWKYILWTLLIFMGVLGGIVKATCYVSVIAVVAVDFAWLIFDRAPASANPQASRPLSALPLPDSLKKLAVRAALLLCGYALAILCKNGMYQAIHYVPDHDLQLTWTNCFYDGLNEATTGACSGDGLAIARAYAGYPRSVRESVELQYAKDRIAERGLVGTLDFWLRKQVMTFNDGTFSWFQEGYFHAWDYEEITSGRLKEPLRNIYWIDGADYPKFVTWSQGVWIFVLLGVLFEAVSVLAASVRFAKGQNPLSEALCMRTVITVAFIGVFLFAMLFEGRARYLLNNIPLLLTMAILGFGEFSQAVWKLLAHNRVGEGSPTRARPMRRFSGIFHPHGAAH